MRQRLFFGLRRGGLIVAGGCVAGLMAVAAMAQKVPYLAVVLEDDTPLRAAAGPTYYTVGSLSAGQMVRVDDVLFNWSRVAVPKGSKSYVRQQHVDRRGDGSIGAINSNYVEVFAIGVEATNTSPEDAYIAHGLVPKGGQVTILESVGSYYLIESPVSAYAFLEPGSVRPASATEIAMWQSSQAPSAGPPEVAPEASPEPASAIAQEVEPEAAPEPEASAVDLASEETAQAIEAIAAAVDPSASEPEPATEPALEVDEAMDAEVEAVSEAPAAETTEVAETVSVESEPVARVEPAGKDAPSILQPSGSSPALLAVEEDMLPLFLLPAEEQPLDQMQQAYAALQEDDSLTQDDRDLVATRLGVIASNRELAETIRQLRAAQKAIEVARAKEAATPSIAPNRYDQIGLLVASSLYDGVSLPKLYRLVDPTSQRTIAYVEPKPGLHDRARMDGLVGKVIGLNGRDKYDASLRRRVFDPVKVELIRPDQPETVEQTGAVSTAG